MNVVLDHEKILNGTPEKRFLRTRAELMNNYDETSAHEFFYTYCDFPLSLILKHSRDIFSETYFGYDFYFDIVKKYLHDPRAYLEEREKVSKYIELAREKRLGKDQIEKYESLLEFLTVSASSYQNLRKCMEIGESCDGGKEFFDKVFDYLYELETLDNSECLDRLLDQFAEDIFSVKNVYCKLPIGFIFCSRYPKYMDILKGFVCEYTKECKTSPEDFGNLKRVQECIGFMMGDSPVCEQLKSVRRDIFYLWSDIANDKFIAENRCNSILNKEIEDIPKMNDSMDPLDIVESVCDITENPYLNDTRNCIKYDNLQRRRAIYEASLDKFPSYDNLSNVDKAIYENTTELIDTMDSELYCLEWEDDGTPNSVIAKHIMTSKERENAENEKNKNMRTPYSVLCDQNQERSKEEVLENKLCDEIKSDIKKLENYSNIGSASDEEDLEKVIKEIRTKMIKYKRLISENAYKKAKSLYDDLDDELKIQDPKYESEYSVDAMLDMFVESDSEKESEKNKKDTEEPKKPKKDIATKIQNKALDKAAKDEERFAKFNEKSQKIKNAANAVSQTPKHIGDDIKSFVARFDKWDDNRRKEFLLKPGFRHKIIKNFKTALKFGLVAHAKLAWVPFLAMLQHASNLKDKRIRNELSMELDNEIKICEEKINDANSAGDNKTKYELMRIKDKLQAEKTRVSVNSKYV